MDIKEEFKKFYLNVVLLNNKSYSQYLHSRNYDLKVTELEKNFNISYNKDLFSINRSNELMSLTDVNDNFKNYSKSKGSGIPNSIVFTHYKSFIDHYNIKIFFSSLQELIDKINKEINNIGKIDNFVQEFRVFRKIMTGQSKIIKPELLFGNVRDNYWTINLGAEKEIQYHIHLNRDGILKYGLGFNIQASANNNDPISLVKPFQKAFYLNKNSIDKDLTDYKFWDNEEKNLKNLNYGTFILYGKELLTKNNNDIFEVNGLDYLKMLYDLKYKQYKAYKTIFEQSKIYSVQTTNDIIMNESNNSTKIKLPLNQILYGPPGTGKTYHTINKAIEIANPSFDLNQDRSIVKAEYNRLVNEGQIAFTTFHQSMSYEDFIEGIKPVVTNDNVTYEIINGIFKTLCFKSNETKDSSNFDDLYELYINEFIENESIVLKTPTHKKPFNIRINSNQSFIVIPQTEKAAEMVVTKKMIRDFIFYGKIRDWKPYTTAICEYFITNYPIDLVEDKKKNHVLIIDEINRGNVSQIFGELITLIEESKRLGNKEELKVTLPYSKEEFGVPNNLYIIGTMNTADRSVEALDTALRRRFSFTEMLPNPAIIDSQNFTDFPRAKIMKKINERIELLLDRNYMLGHAYFMKDNFKHSFENEIVPLLQEYFYNDYSKIGLVLGKGFVRIKTTSLQNVSNVFADFDTIHDIDLIKTYELIPFNEINFEEALSLLIH